MAGVVKSTLHLRDGCVDVRLSDGAEAELPVAVLLRSKLLKESPDIESSLDQIHPGAETALQFNVYAPDQYLEAWLASLVLLERLQFAAAPDGLLAVATDTIAQYVKVWKSMSRAFCGFNFLRDAVSVYVHC